MSDDIAVDDDMPASHHEASKAAWRFEPLPDSIKADEVAVKYYISEIVDAYSDLNVASLETADSDELAQEHRSIVDVRIPAAYDKMKAHVAEANKVVSSFNPAEHTPEKIAEKVVDRLANHSEQVGALGAFYTSIGYNAEQGGAGTGLTESNKSDPKLG